MKVQSKDKIEKILNDVPVSRSNDKLLMLMVWEAEGLPMGDVFKRIFLSKQVSSPETIRRVRQKLQEQGKYQAADAVKEARKELEQETRDQLRQGTLLGGDWFL